MSARRRRPRRWPSRVACSAGTGEGGYARQLSDDEAQAQQHALDAAISRFDLVITTAQVPGRRPPVLVTADALDRLRPGSVVVDLAASELGGNVAGSIPDATIITPRGVAVIGAGNLPSTVPQAASTAYARNVCALLPVLVADGEIKIDLVDEIQAGVVVTHDGAIVHPQVRATLDRKEAVMTACTERHPGRAADGVEGEGQKDMTKEAES